MRALMWIIRLLIFFLLLGFAVKNDHLASVHFFFGGEWQLPLVFVILLSVAAGALLGVTATFASWLRQGREISRLRRQLERAGRDRPQAAPGAAAQAPESF